MPENFYNALEYARDEFLDLGLDPTWGTSILWAEHDDDPQAYNPMAMSKAGARGPMQVTRIAYYDVKRLGKIKGSALNKVMSKDDFDLNLDDPYDNIRAGALYSKALKDHYKITNPRQFASAYNAGPKRKNLFRTNKDVKHYTDVFAKRQKIASQNDNETLNQSGADDMLEDDSDVGNEPLLLQRLLRATGLTGSQANTARPNPSPFGRQPVPVGINYDAAPLADEQIAGAGLAPAGVNVEQLRPGDTTDYNAERQWNMQGLSQFLPWLRRSFNPPEAPLGYQPNAPVDETDYNAVRRWGNVAEAPMFPPQPAGPGAYSQPPTPLAAEQPNAPSAPLPEGARDVVGLPWLAAPNTTPALPPGAREVEGMPWLDESQDFTKSLSENPLVRFGLTLAQGRGAGLRGAMSDVAAAGTTTLDAMAAMRQKQAAIGMAQAELKLKAQDSASKRMSAMADMIKAQAETEGLTTADMAILYRTIAGDLGLNLNMDPKALKKLIDPMVTDYAEMKRRAKSGGSGQSSAAAPTGRTTIVNGKIVLK